MKQDVIVGAGLSGLAAVYLQRQGRKVIKKVVNAGR
jgi:phytoene dehydrogenase-like protein